MDKLITDYWFSYYVNTTTGVCLLCMNSGIIDTSACSANGAWKRLQKHFPCICPNGQAKRKQQEAEV